MSIKIHHGPPGSYKTSGAVMDDFIPAAKAGRTIVTNVRGLSSVDRVVEVLGDVPPEFDLIYLPTAEHPDSAKHRDDLAKWFHWLPHGAFLLLDEAQMIWPPSWKEKDLDALDYPGGIAAANQANRPATWSTAFEMHRHYGWDMVLTTPNIDRLRKDVRQVAEGAYKHKNQALIGIKGRYLEAFHMADDSGKSASDFLTLRMRKIRKEVWQLYESTATGTHSDTIAGLSLLANPRVLLLLGALALAVTWFVGHGPPAVLGGGAKRVGDALGTATGQAATVVGLTASATPSRDAGPVAADPVQSRPASFFDGIRLYLKGRYGLVDAPRYLFQAEADKGGTWHLTDEEITRAGGQIVALGDCAVKIVFRGDVRLVNCRAEREADGAKLKSLF